jgi:hypothetical protein
MQTIYQPTGQAREYGETKMDIETFTSNCELCEAEYQSDGYQWTCDKCRTQKECQCGCDDVILEWHIISDMDGKIQPEPMWAVECQMCEKITSYFKTAKEAVADWNTNINFTLDKPPFVK